MAAGVRKVMTSGTVVVVTVAATLDVVLAVTAAMLSAVGPWNVSATGLVKAVQFVPNSATVDPVVGRARDPGIEKVRCLGGRREVVRAGYGVHGSEQVDAGGTGREVRGIGAADRHTLKGGRDIDQRRGGGWRPDDDATDRSGCWRPCSAG